MRLDAWLSDAVEDEKSLNGSIDSKTCSSPGKSKASTFLTSKKSQQNVVQSKVEHIVKLREESDESDSSEESNSVSNQSSTGSSKIKIRRGSVKYAVKEIKWSNKTINFIKDEPNSKVVYSKIIFGNNSFLYRSSDDQYN